MRHRIHPGPKRVDSAGNGKAGMIAHGGRANRALVVLRPSLNSH
jgi:hypothetical protein